MKRPHEFLEPGTPFAPLNRCPYGSKTSIRVMPSQFGFPILPAACTFLLDIHEQKDTSFI